MKKILIIEDDVYLREELVHTFKQKGYVVSSISSFATVKQDTLSYGPDLLILDITLPGTTLFDHYPSTVSKEELTRIVWENENYISENILSVNLTRLRKTLKTINLESLIQTKREIGYCIKVADDTKFGTTSKG